jgi:hypothetical protein
MSLSAGRRTVRQARWRFLLIAVLLVPAEKAWAASLTVDGVTFSDELGGFVLEGVTGSGSMDDPFVVIERMTSASGGILRFRMDPAFGNRIGSQHTIGFALIKVIENATDFTWNSFELELQSQLGVPSDTMRMACRLARVRRLAGLSRPWNLPGSR